MKRKTTSCLSLETVYFYLLSLPFLYRFVLPPLLKKKQRKIALVAELITNSANAIFDKKPQLIKENVGVECAEHCAYHFWRALNNYSFSSIPCVQLF